MNNNYKIDSNKRAQLIKEHDNKCDVCGYTFNQVLHIHHILPLCEKGDCTSDNLSVLCPNCHAIIHRLISCYNHESDTSEIDSWIEDNYTVNDSKRLYEIFYKCLSDKREKVKHE